MEDQLDLTNGSFGSGMDRVKFGWVMFGLNDISGRFGLGRVWFGSGQPVFG